MQYSLFTHTCIYIHTHTHSFIILSTMYYIYIYIYLYVCIKTLFVRCSNRPGVMTPATAQTRNKQNNIQHSNLLLSVWWERWTVDSAEEIIIIFARQLCFAACVCTRVFFLAAVEPKSTYIVLCIVPILVFSAEKRGRRRTSLSPNLFPKQGPNITCYNNDVPTYKYDYIVYYCVYLLVTNTL